MLQILGWLNRRNFNSGPWRDVGGQVSVESVDMAVVHLCDLDEGGTLGSLAPPRSEKPVQAACLSRESNKKTAPCGTVKKPAGDWFLIASGRQDSNLRHLAPKASNSCSRGLLKPSHRRSPDDMFAMNAVSRCRQMLDVFGTPLAQS